MRYQENETNAITGEIPSGCHDVTFVLDNVGQLPDSWRYDELINIASRVSLRIFFAQMLILATMNIIGRFKARLRPICFLIILVNPYWIQK